MGYSEYPLDDELKVKFKVLKIYSLQGIVFEKNIETIPSDIFVFESCKVVASRSINEASKLLLGDILEDNEQKWLSEKKATPPFVVLYFNDDKEYVLNGGFRQKDGESIITHNAFSDADEKITNWTKLTLPNIFTALTVHFSTINNHVKLIPIDERIWGETDNNQTLFNLRSSMNSEFYVSIPQKLDEVNLSLQNSVNLFSNLNEKLSRHIFAALIESDRLKQFLYFFLFMEIYTNEQYKKLDSKQRKFDENRKADGELYNKFNCCKISIWKHLNDEDVECFKKMKKIRNDILHGQDIEEATLPIEKIRTLALKLLRTAQFTR